MYFVDGESNVVILDEVSIPLVRFLHERHQSVFFRINLVNLDPILWISPETVCREKQGSSFERKSKINLSVNMKLKAMKVCPQHAGLSIT